MERKWWTLLVVCVGTFMLLLDITIVNVALPKIAIELKASFSDIQWVIDAYALTLASVLLTTGALADLFGRRLLFAIGLVLFAFTSLLCALSPSALFLILARAGQGIGGAIMFSTSLALLVQEFHGKERGMALGVWGATIGGAAAVGPLLGGALTEGVRLVLDLLHQCPDRHRRGGADHDQDRRVEQSERHARGLDRHRHLHRIPVPARTGDHPRQLRGLGQHVHRRTVRRLDRPADRLSVAQFTQDNAMLDVTLFRKPTFSGASIVAFALSASMFAMFLYLTLYLQTILGLSPLQTGLRFLPITLLSFVVAAVSGNLSSRVPVKFLLSLGLLLVGSGLLLMRGLTGSSGWTALLAGFVVAGAGIGLVNPALASTAVGVVPPQRSGMASGINSTFRQVGIATGIAILGAIFESSIASKLAPHAGRHAGRGPHLAARPRDRRGRCAGRAQRNSRRPARPCRRRDPQRLCRRDERHPARGRESSPWPAPCSASCSSAAPTSSPTARRRAEPAPAAA